MSSVNVSSEEGLRTIIKTDTHTWYADEPESAGGTDTAATPMEMMLGALGSCIIMTVLMYANRKNWIVDRIDVSLAIQRFNAADYPAYKGDAQFVHEIREHVSLHSTELSDEQRERLMEIAKKCPVRRVLSNPTFFVEPESVTQA